LIADFYQQIFTLRTDPDPILKFREHLADCVLGYASLQVLCRRTSIAFTATASNSLGNGLCLCCADHRSASASRSNVRSGKKKTAATVGSSVGQFGPPTATNAREFPARSERLPLALFNSKPIVDAADDVRMCLGLEEPAG
jgi:hypothetical protein